MKYAIIERSTSENLEAAVNERLADGWQLCGGVVVCAVYRSWTNERKGYEESETDYTYAQALTIE